MEFVSKFDGTELLLQSNGRLEFACLIHNQDKWKITFQEKKHDWSKHVSRVYTWNHLTSLSSWRYRETEQEGINTEFGNMFGEAELLVKFSGVKSLIYQANTKETSF